MTMMPTGFRFNPTDEELIQLLHRKVSGQEMHFHNHIILQTDVYDIDPKYMQWDHNLILSSKGRFYYCLRENNSREVSGRGWWKATSHATKIYASYNNQLLVGFKGPLTFHRFRYGSDIEGRRKNAIKTNWITHEYSLEPNSTVASNFMEWRLCKIKYKGKASVQEEQENIRNPSSPILAEQQQQQTPQSLQLISDSNFSHSSRVENRQNQQHSSLADNLYGNEPSNLGELNLEVQAIDIEQQQQMSFCDPYYACFDDDQLQKFADSSEQLFPGIWSWHADL